MPSVHAPAAIDSDYVAKLRARKHEFVTPQHAIAQHGAAVLAMDGWPGWPADLVSLEPAIETYVASATIVEPTSTNEPYVSCWQPLVDWMNRAVRDELATYGLTLEDAYVTASVSDSPSLEGLAHMDDDTYQPHESVGVVAIIGEHAGPRIATGTLQHHELRPMSQVVFDHELLEAFGADALDHCQAAADQLVVFPQFGQVHAGPAAHHVHNATRQLLVLRARATLDDNA